MSSLQLELPSQSSFRISSGPPGAGLVRHFTDSEHRCGTIRVSETSLVAKHLSILCVFAVLAGSLSHGQAHSRRQIPGQRRQPAAALMGRVVHLVPTAAGPAEPVSLPAAAIEIKNLATSAVYKATADAEGGFRIRGLAPGDYQVSAVLNGYRQFVRSGVRLKASEVLVLELTLTGEPVAPSLTAETPAQESPPPSSEGEYRE